MSSWAKGYNKSPRGSGPVEEDWRREYSAYSFIDLLFEPYPERPSNRYYPDERSQGPVDSKMQYRQASDGCSIFWFGS